MRQIILKTRTWLAFARLPFHLVGVLPFVLGTLLVWHTGNHLYGVIFTLGALGVIAVMLTAYFSG
jgi:1,4-dihydroxy-2-naphthoate polyprenyltransferase